MTKPEATAGMGWTPGPWVAMGSRVLASDPHSDEALSIADCDMDTRIDHDTTACTNARLIAAAPELADALREIANFRLVSTADYNACEMGDIARAALAKLETGHE